MSIKELLAIVAVLALGFSMAYGMANEARRSAIDWEMDVGEGGFLDNLPDPRGGYLYNFNDDSKADASCISITSRFASIGKDIENPIVCFDLGAFGKEGAGLHGPCICAVAYLDAVRVDWFRFLGIFEKAGIGGWVGRDFEFTEWDYGVVIQLAGLSFGKRPE